MAVKRPGHTFTRQSLNEDDKSSDKSDEAPSTKTYYPRPSYQADGDDAILSGFSSPSSLNLDDRINFCLKAMMTHKDLIDPGYQAVLTTVQRILQELKFITDCMQRQDDLEDEKNDWKFVAVVIDRLCLYIFSFFIVVGTCAIVFSAPHLS